ncbi:MASE1 domain-containing protein [Serratia sp. UGAL515B_01]|uniref:MASE1 domain-containing protein n=1 Tax=Serratia sp. UGAL515B_01 TaxID=2986763 RepID=UPI002953CF4A|nr:MASE1 domain-containing protein [Serratia sp. UGAL515B_01]WON77972.1 MASE1 domain-containing protein [Serratia sp. UGAL515B_01]
MKSYSSLLRQIFILLLWGLAFYVAGLVSLKFDDPDSPIAIVWFPAGVAVAAFLYARWREYPLLFLLFTFVNVLFDKGSQDNLLLLLIYSFVSMPASVAIAWVVRRFARLNDDLHVVLLWIGATLVISGLDALIVGGGYALLNGQPALSLFWRSFIADVTGIIFATAVVMGFMSRRGTVVTKNILTRLTGVILWFLLCAVTWIIFAHHWPWLQEHAAALYFALACLPIVLVIAITVLSGNRGASVSLLALGIIVIHFTDLRKGPFFIDGLDLAESLLLAQSYLSATALLVAFIRVVEHATNSFNPDTGRIVGNGVLYSLDTRSGTLSWSNEISTLFGHLEPRMLDSVDAVLQRVHPLDRDKLYNHWFSSYGLVKRPSLVFRIQTANGEWLTLVDSGGIQMVSGEKRVIVGNWQSSQYRLPSE